MSKKLRPGIASRGKWAGNGAWESKQRGPQVQCTFLNWSAPGTPGVLVVTAYNSCILINALL